MSGAVCGVDGVAVAGAVEIAAPRMEARPEAATPCPPGAAVAMGAVVAPARSWSISAARKPALASPAGAVVPPAAAATVLVGLDEL